MKAAGSFGREPQKCLQSEQARKQKKWAGQTAKLCIVLWKGMVQDIAGNSTNLEKDVQTCIFLKNGNLNLLDPNKSIPRWIIIRVKTEEQTVREERERQCITQKTIIGTISCISPETIETEELEKKICQIDFYIKQKYPIGRNDRSNASRYNNQQQKVWRVKNKSQGI